MGVTILICAAGGATAASGQPPTIQRVQPLGIAPGQTTELQVIGQHLTPATRLWTSCGAVSQPAAEKPGGYFALTVPADVPLGIHGLRVVSEHGVSTMSLFLVDDLPAVAVSPAALNRETPQALTLPMAVDGAVDNLQRHFFRFDVAAGQTVSFDVLARRLGSPLDPSIILYNAEGRELAYADDVAGLGGDCHLSQTFDAAASCVLELRDIRYEGSGGHFYRLRIGDFPCLSVPYPLAVGRGRHTRVDFAGASTADADPAHVEVPADWPHDWFPVSTRRSGGVCHAFTTVAVTDDVEHREQEPNDTPAQANRITLGDNINGRFERPADVDRFTFSAKKGQRFTFRGVTRQRGAAPDLVLELVDADGKQLARKDDDGTEEGAIDHTFAADGEFTLVVVDLHGRGGQPYAYRVSIEPFVPGVLLSAAADSLNIPAGGIGALAVNVVRQAEAGPVKIAAEGLPDGWTSLPTILGPGVNAGVLTIRGPTVAPTPPQIAPLTLVGTAGSGGAATPAIADVSAALTAQWNNIPVVPLNVNTSIAAAVTSPSPFALRFEPAEVVVGPHLKASVKVLVERGAAITEAIALTTLPEKNALPADVTLALKPIDKGQNEVVLEIAGGPKAPLSMFSLVLTASHTKENVAQVVTSPPLVFRCEPPLQLRVDAGDRHLPRGSEQTLSVQVTRNPAFAGDVTLSLVKLPTGVTADPVILPAARNTIDVTLKAAADAAPGEHGDILVKATAAGNDNLTATEELGKLTIQ